MNTVETAQTRCRAGVSRCDATQPVGIYHRMWGAATHERATGIHKRLLASVLWLEPADGDRQRALAVVAVDHCLLDGPDVEQIRSEIAERSGITPPQVQVACSHTHAAGLLSRSRAGLPGGELIGPYLDELASKCAAAAEAAAAGAELANISYGIGRCNLAQHRDFWDEANGQYVCGYNPLGAADDTLLVAKVTTFEGGFRALATIVNYACHPTTLAWQNTLISPDYVAALRETVEQHTQAPCLFLQGASGDLGPREGFVGDTQVADRNGRQLGFAALAALESLPPPITRYAYNGPVVSGATIGTWQHQPLDPSAMQRISAWQVGELTVDLPYRSDLPSHEAAERELAHWQLEEAAASERGDAARARDSHARVEQMQRQLWRLKALPAGDAFPLNVTLLRLGDAVWLFVPAEHYQTLQTTLRERFPQTPIVVTTIANGWQPGYIPSAATYGKGIYQEQIAVVAAGSAERLIEAIGAQIADVVIAKPGNGSLPTDD